MALTKIPFFSLASQGTLGKTITTQRRNKGTMARLKPTPTDRRSLPQMYNRWYYDDVVAHWNTLSSAEKQTWKSLGGRHRNTGLGEFLRHYLKDKPDVAGWWTLDEQTGAVAHDRSSYANHATIIGASPCVAVIDGGRYFDGLNDQLTVPHSPSLDITDVITMEAFVWPDGIQANWNRILNKGVLVARSYFLTFETGTLKVFGAVQDAGGANHVSPRVAIPNQTFTHVCVRYDKINVELYLNGVYQGGNPYAGDIRSTTHPLFIGNEHLENYWLKGYLDNVIIHNVALDPAVIKLHSERRYPL